MHTKRKIAVNLHNGKKFTFENVISINTRDDILYIVTMKKDEDSCVAGLFHLHDVKYVVDSETRVENPKPTLPKNPIL